MQDSSPELERRPPLCDRGHTLIVGYVPPATGGSSILTHNLVAQFDPGSVTVATVGNQNRNTFNTSQLIRSTVIFRAVNFSRRLNEIIFSLQRPLALRKLISLGRSLNVKVIVGCYPDYHFLSVAREAAQRLQIPFIPYLHDTVLEGILSEDHRERTRRLQDDIFRDASHVLVMSEGMAQLYQEKYAMQRPTALEHIYPEPVSRSVPGPVNSKSAFWGGHVYEINARAVGRVTRALRSTNGYLQVATDRPASALEALGLDMEATKTAFYPDRRNYLAALREHGMLILALDFPDESPVHEDELATIFPTKTAEYLASGRPILLHCPEHYFLARFFKEHRCGVVVSDRSEQALVKAIREIHEGGESVAQLIDAALDTTKIFSPARVAKRFKAVVNAVANVGWRDKITLTEDQLSGV